MADAIPSLLIEASAVGITRGKKSLIGGLDLSVGRAARVGITGRSGVGKTMLIQSIVQQAIGGASVHCSGELTVRAEKIGYAPQIPAIPQWFALGSLFRRIIDRAEPSRRLDIDHLLDPFGLRKLQSQFPRSLSGGELQRMSLAVALGLAGDLVILDEPLTGLDWATKVETMEATLAFLIKHGIALLLVSHDLDLLLWLTECVHILGAGGIADSLPVAAGRHGSVDLAGMELTVKRHELLRKLGSVPLRSGGSAVAAPTVMS